MIIKRKRKYSGKFCGYYLGLSFQRNCYISFAKIPKDYFLPSAIIDNILPVC